MDTDTFTIPTSSNSNTPKEYIRTLSGDMMTLQRGGIPDLELLKRNGGEAPLGEYLTDVSTENEESKSSPVERLIESSPLPPVSILPALPTQIDTPPVPPAPPKPEIVAPPVLPAPPASPKPASLETYANDFRNRMKETGASTLTVLAAEQDASPVMMQVTPTIPEESSQKSRWFVGVGVALLIISIIGMVVAYSRYIVVGMPVTLVQHASAPIFFDSSAEISGTSVQLMQAVKKSAGDPLSSNTVRFLAIASTTSVGSIFTALNMHAPGLLMRNIEATGGMVGIVNTSGGQYPFFILPVSSYAATFSGMLAWEPVIFNDLGTLFPVSPSPAQKPVPITSATTTATTTVSNIKTATTTAVKTPNKKAGFRDEVVSNHDVRVYRDAENKSLILYGYWNQSTLVIARDPSAFAEILGRLATAHAAQ